ncbi:MAG: NusG domain II-containing protein [Clostridia bacterium]|nr:NusG domain II-containing protein [Clostridia bacterium]
MKSKQRVRNDVIFIVALLAVIAIAGACLYFLRGEGDTVTVSIDGKVVATYPLDEDLVKDIHTEGDGLNRLIIRDGKAWVEKASCPDGICAAHKPIHREGESIICLPNKVVITVQTADTTNEPDIVI